MLNLIVNTQLNGVCFKKITPELLGHATRYLKGCIFVRTNEFAHDTVYGVIRSPLNGTQASPLTNDRTVLIAGVELPLGYSVT